MSTAPPKLRELALAVLETQSAQPAFVNDVLDALAQVDSGCKIYWNNFHQDKQVRKTFRAFLSGLGLVEVEKRTLKSGGHIHMAFVRGAADARSSVFAEARAVLAASLRELVQRQVAALAEERACVAAEEAATAGPTVVRATEVIRLESPSEEPESRVAGGLMSLDAYRELRAAGALQTSLDAATALPEPAPAADIFAAASRDAAAIAKFSRAQRLQHELWGLSAGRQHKLRRQLGAPEEGGAAAEGGAAEKGSADSSTR